jgi:hypothetical protein
MEAERLTAPCGRGSVWVPGGTRDVLSRARKSRRENSKILFVLPSLTHGVPYGALRASGKQRGASRA